jgi:hypothetical protein
MSCVLWIDEGISTLEGELAGVLIIYGIQYDEIVE